MGSKARYYWCVKVPEFICPAKEIYLHADKVQVIDNDLCFISKDSEGGERIIISFLKLLMMRMI